MLFIAKKIFFLWKEKKKKKKMGQSLCSALSPL